MQVKERFLNYVSFDTISSETSTTFPSTEHQKELGRRLVKEMQAIGIQDAAMDENGYVFGSIPSNILGKQPPVIGFVAHMDTSPDISGKNIKARVVERYDGGDIVLNAEKNIVLRPSEFDSLAQYVGQDLIVTDGTTLLGCDDKGGIAEIMALAEHLLQHPEIEHGTVKIGFTPDEEVGQGADRFDVKKFGADYAYTVDGGALGELEYENFNAASGKVTVHGVNIHPGSAKGKMANSILIAMEFNAMLPTGQRPDLTEGYEGFFHLNSMAGDVEATTLHYIIRDHDKTLFEQKKAQFERIAAFLNDKYGAGTVEVQVKDSYYNMKEQIRPHWHLIENAEKAMRALGVEPVTVPIRGGTDGARLSFMGLPCPNLGTGGHNFHGRYEYCCVQSMEKTAEILLKITELYAAL